jgi:hypothetical protein
MNYVFNLLLITMCTISAIESITNPNILTLTALSLSAVILCTNVFNPLFKK